MSLELKIKSKHLSVESAIIRHEENKLRKRIERAKAKTELDRIAELQGKRKSLSDHRKIDVRNESRATFIARAFIANKSYLSTENKRKAEKEYSFSYAILPRVLKMINKYSNKTVTKKDLEDWISK